jgi:DNA-directed RNA polymerase specialized sigma24 family protein
MSEMSTLPQEARLATPAMGPDLTDEMFIDQLALILPVLRRFARRLCSQHAMADDLTQEAVMRGWAPAPIWCPTATCAHGSS